ncbi:hypothetical protein [Gordonia sp. N1V]|uniref:hypothetical protein n=1 Tax=Gordonia sp. N1V TaxID=3034163 RepID=UPI0023E11670|nr:hypothetical protein [Gordonia sp. N1V]MDF3285479.1 hypothetical protein [Gordonia sp. N1V]
MIPTYDVDIHVRETFESTDFWQPAPSDIDEEGFAYFQDAWPILSPSVADTAAVIASEEVGLAFLEWTCRDAAQFDEVARDLEAFVLNEPLPDDVADAFTGLNGLEVGVAGLVYALACTGYYPAASCRSHAERSWSDCPVVFFATAEPRLRNLIPLAVEAGCGLDANNSRGVPLFVLYAPSTVEMANLARAVFAQRTELRAMPKTSRRQLSRYRTPLPTQLNLFDMLTRSDSGERPCQ